MKTKIQPIIKLAIDYNEFQILYTAVCEYRDALKEQDDPELAADAGAILYELRKLGTGCDKVIKAMHGNG